MRTEIILFPFMMWAYHLVPALLVSGPVWFLGRRRVHWCWSDYLVVVAPFATWMTLMFLDGTGKSLANLVEAFCIGCVAPSAPIVRVLLKDRVNQAVLSRSLLVLLCGVGAGLYYLVPALPE